MCSLSMSCRPLFLLAALLINAALASSTPKALSVTPSTTWYGDDGSWSAISIRVGSPQQWVDVMISTASSETWVISPFGCGDSSICETDRGGLFDFRKSSTWHTEGFYELGLDTQLGFTGYGDYGLDILEFGTTGVSLNNSIISSINGTEYWLGYFGLGVIPGNFTNSTVLSPISGLVEISGSIPSHSYGFTAGANYQQKGEPCSLTLGGFDANRFIAHDISFELNPQQQLEAFLSSISVVAGTSTGKVQNWSSNPLQLLAPADGVSIIIDSSTPFLWLPKSVCESFAKALGLTYNESLALYTFDGNITTPNDLRAWNLNFTFSLADQARSAQIVNITLPYAAFDLQLSYPFILNTTFENGDKYYFPLRQAANDTQYTLGRAFLQETYLITDYERNNFSVYQAVHPEDPLGNTSIVDITRPSTSHFSGGPEDTTSAGLSTTNIVLICIGTVLFLLLLALSFFIIRRWRAKHITDENECGPVNTSTAPKGGEKAQEVWPPRGAMSIAATEISASADTERFELAVPQVPVELEGTQVPGRGSERDTTSVSDGSLHLGGGYSSISSSSYSPVSLPGSSARTMEITPTLMSPLSPPPIYQSPSTRVHRLRATRDIRGRLDEPEMEPEPNHKFLYSEMRRNRSGDVAGDTKN